MTTENLKNWLKTQLPGMRFEVGGVDENAAEFLGVLPLESAAPRICVGGAENTQYDTMDADLILRYGDDFVAAEQKANEIAGLFYGLHNTIMDGIQVASAEAKRPRFMGRVLGVCVFAMRVKIYFERSK